MKRFSKIFMTLLAGLIPSLAGCTDDFRLPDNGPEQYDGIVLRVPDPSTLSSAMTRADVTRAELDLAEGEGKLTSLWIFAVDGDTFLKKEIDLDDTNNVLEAHDGYQNYDITDMFRPEGSNKVTTGKFKFYILANVDSYSDKTFDNMTSEEDVKNLQLHFYKHGETDDEVANLLNKTYIGAHGLPMACLPAAVSIKKSGSKDYDDADTDGKIEIGSNTNGAILADLSFLCSKVRYTVFFDNTTGTCEEIFGSKSFKLTNVGATNVFCGSTTVSGTADETEGISKGDAHEYPNFVFEEKVWPTNAPEYPDTEDDKNTDLKKLETVNEAAGQRVFQGTVYLPENLDATNRTTINFTADVMDGGNKGTTLTYTMPLLPAKGDESTDIECSHAYDIAANVTRLGGTMEIQFAGVKDWTAETIKYSLQLPSYLDVDDTSIALQAGNEVGIGYSSNAALSFESPVYENGGEKIPVYRVRAEGGKILVTVNPLITDDMFGPIQNNMEKYNFFHVTAGNIRKKIEVDLTLKRYLRVGPSPITIDARELIASSKYSGGYEIQIETNIASFTIEDLKLSEGDTKGGWAIANPGNDLTLESSSDDAAGKLNFTESKNIYSFNTEAVTKGDNRLVLNLDYKNLNGGELWKEQHTIRLRVAVPNDGYAEGSDGYVDPVDVAIYLRPNNDDYVIYFRSNSITDPHIYVYQCLEMPSSLSTTDYYFNKDGVKYTFASRTVGFYRQDTGNPYVVSALEYSFTGAAAFKGWDAPINAKSLADVKGKHNQGDIVDGFYFFTTDVNPDWSERYTNSDEDKMRYHVGTDVDFCSEHRKNVDCTDCKNGTGNPGWPGIKMIYQKEGENKGWWKFTLSGVATPGKALIIFTNTHGGDSNNQAPGAGEPGLVLFGFPERVGYYDHANGAKGWSTSPDGSSEEGGGGGGPVDVDVFRHYCMEWNKERDGKTREKIVYTEIPDGVTDDNGDAVSLNTILDATPSGNNMKHFLKAAEGISGTVKGYVCNSSGGDQAYFEYKIESNHTTGNTYYYHANGAW